MKKIVKRGLSILVCMTLITGMMVQSVLAAKKVSLNKTSVKISVGESFTLKLSGSSIKSAKSSNKKVASVNKKGKITAKKKGKATITVTGKNKKKYKCRVTVIAKVSPKKVYAAYKKIIEGINKPNRSQQDIWYSLFDLTGDKTPELIVKHGTCEGDMVYDVYEYRSRKAKKIGKIDAWHTALGSVKNRQLIQYVKSARSVEVYRITVSSGKIKSKKLYSYSSDDFITDDEEYLSGMRKAGVDYDSIFWLTTYYYESDGLYGLDEIYG